MKNWLLPTLLILLSACDGGAEMGSQMTLTEQYPGRWVIVNYWAQWCKPCIEEIPQLNALDQTYPQIAVLGVNYDGATGGELAKQVAQLGIEFPILANDPAAELGTARPVVLPTTLILDPDGRLLHTLIGPQTLESLALATGQLAISEPGPTTQDLIDRQP